MSSASKGDLDRAKVQAAFEHASGNTPKDFFLKFFGWDNQQYEGAAALVYKLLKDHGLVRELDPQGKPIRAKRDAKTNAKRLDIEREIISGAHKECDYFLSAHGGPDADRPLWFTDFISTDTNDREPNFKRAIQRFISLLFSKPLRAKTEPVEPSGASKSEVATPRQRRSTAPVSEIETTDNEPEPKSNPELEPKTKTKHDRAPKRPKISHDASSAHQLFTVSQQEGFQTSTYQVNHVFKAEEDGDFVVQQLDYGTVTELSSTQQRRPRGSHVSPEGPARQTHERQ